MVRHAESAYNVAGRVNGDPELSVVLSTRGLEQAHALAEQIRHFEVGVVIHTRFERTIETARLMFGAPAPPLVCEPLLDDIACGSMEGWPVAEDHEWRGAHRRDHRPRGGESIRDAALRIARGLRAVSSRPERVVAVVSHELVVRYALNAAADNADIAGPHRDIPHATPFVFDRQELAAAADRIDALASGAWGSAVPEAAANGG